MEKDLRLKCPSLSHRPLIRPRLRYQLIQRCWIYQLDPAVPAGADRSAAWEILQLNMLARAKNASAKGKDRQLRPQYSCTPIARVAAISEALRTLGYGPLPAPAILAPNAFHGSAGVDRGLGREQLCRVDSWRPAWRAHAHRPGPGRALQCRRNLSTPALCSGDCLSDSTSPPGTPGRDSHA